MWTLADFCILVDTKWIPSDTCKNYHTSWHLEFILEFKSSAHWDLRIFIKQKENVRFPSPTSLLGNPCLICPSPDATMACPQTSALSLMGSQLSEPIFGLQLEYCLQQFPRENFFFLFCLVIAFPLGLQLSCAKHWLIMSIDTCLTEIYPSFSLWSSVSPSVKWKQ